MSDWVEIYTTNQHFEAELIKQNLSNHDIPVVLLNKMDNFYRFGYIEIMVKRDFVLRGKKLIEDFLNEK